MVGGLEFCEEPPVLRFFAGKMKPKSDWPERLADAFERDFGPGC
jgi:tryptophanase